MQIRYIRRALALAVSVLGSYNLVIILVVIQLYTNQLALIYIEFLIVLLIALIASISLMLASIFKPQFESQLRFETAEDRLKFWITLHVFFNLFLIVDIAIAAFAIGSLAGRTGAYPPFISAAALIMGFFLLFGAVGRSAFCNLLDQRYEGIGGDSVLGVAALGFQALDEFRRRSKRGLLFLENALELYSRELASDYIYSEVAPLVIFVLHGLESVQIEDEDYDKLAQIAKSMSEYPKSMLDLPPALSAFLQARIRNPAEIRVIQPPKRSLYDTIAVAAALLAAASAMLAALISDNIRMAIIQSFSQNSVVIFFGLGAIYLWMLSFRIWLRLLNTPVSLRIFRSHVLKPDPGTKINKRLQRQQLNEQIKRLKTRQSS